MFNLFGRKTAKDFLKEAQETYSVPEVKPVKAPASSPQEHYRVGFDDSGMTTLTLMCGNSTMTLSMNQEACEQMIRMIRATYKDIEFTEVENV